MSIIIMAVVFIVKELNERYKARLPVPIPIEVIMVSGAVLLSNMSGQFPKLQLSFSLCLQTVIACGVSYGFNFNKVYNVHIVGKMVRGYVSVSYFIVCNTTCCTVHALMWCFDLSALNLQYMHFRYEAPVAPNVQVLRESALDAFPTAIVGFAVAFSVAKVYSIKHDYIIDGNQVSNPAAELREKGQI